MLVFVREPAFGFACDHNVSWNALEPFGNTFLTRQEAQRAFLADVNDDGILRCAFACGDLPPVPNAKHAGLLE